MQKTVRSQSNCSIGYTNDNNYMLRNASGGPFSLGRTQFTGLFKQDNSYESSCWRLTIIRAVFL